MPKVKRQDMTKEQLERLKLLQETGLRSYSVTMASVLFAAASVVVALVTSIGDAVKSDRDHAVACASLAVSLTNVVTSTAAAIKGLDQKAINSYIWQETTLLPPDLAVAFYSAFDNKLDADGRNAQELQSILKTKKNNLLTTCLSTKS